MGSAVAATLRRRCQLKTLCFWAGRVRDLLADLNELGRSAFGGQYVDVFCSTARRAADDAASMDGLHYDDEANWLKAQVVLGRICDGS